MRRRSGLIAAALCPVSAAALGWGLTATAGAAPDPAGVTPRVGATPPPPPPSGPASPAWGHAEQEPGIAALDHNGGGVLEAVACPAKGACSAGGFYSDGVTKKQQAFVIGETMFSPGGYQLTASYPGRGGFAGSASGPGTLKVTR